MAELQMLDDSTLSRIDGQSGLSVDMSLKMKIGEIAYFDDGNGLELQNIRLGSAADISQKAKMKYKIDIAADSGLLLDYDIEPTRLFVGDVRLTDDQIDSMGGFGWDFAIEGTTRLSQDGVTYPGQGGVGLDAYFVLTDGRFIYKTNGNEIFYDDIAMTVNAPGMVWEPNSANGIDFKIPTLQGAFSIGGIRYSNAPAGTVDVYDKAAAALLPSFGSVRGDFDLSANYQIIGGGKYGAAGVSIDSQHVINSMNLIYSDDGRDLSFLAITGAYNVDGMHIDVAADTYGDQALSIAYDQVKGYVSIGQLLAGATQDSFGGFRFDFDWSDQVVDSTNYTNQFYFKGGGNQLAGPQGMAIDAIWSLNDSSLSYMEDGSTVMLSGLRSWGHGVVTADVTRLQTISGIEYFDGLRIGFENFSGGYQIDGLKVGRSSDDFSTKTLQGGTELLWALGIFPAYDFNINGHVTLGAGGNAGDGITINSDVVIDQANAAFMIDDHENGLWLTGMDYDVHLRDMTIDITEDGIQFAKAEAWSTMDISDLKVGQKDLGDSFGRLVFQGYETGSTMLIKPGGAQGVEGITIELKQVFAKAVDATRRNRIMWQTNRSGASGGTAIIFDDISTNDANDSGNTYGFRNDINIDIAETTVIDKTTGVVSNPLGLAVKAHTSFQELDIGSVQFQHGSSAPETGIYGMKLNNFSIMSNLTATPTD